MNRKLLAAAVAGAFALPGAALAQSTIQIYGNVNVDVERIEGGGSAPQLSGNRWRVQNPGGTRIGFRGTERIAGSTSAWYQVESNIGGTDGTANGVWGSRNSGVGLQGGWGTLIVGQWDSPYKNVAGRLQPFGATTLGGTNAIMQNGDATSQAPSVTVGGAAIGTAGTGVVTVGAALAAPFHRRLSNTIQYHSPTLSGFQGRIAYQANEGKTQNLGAGNVDPDLWSMSVGYDNGPLFVALAYERHNDFTRVGGTDKAWMIAAQYVFAKAFEIGFGYEKLKYDTGTAAAPTNLDQKNWQLHGRFMTGPHSIGLMYVKADDASGNFVGTLGRINAVAPGTPGGTGSDMWTIEYSYALSKRSQLVAAYSKLDNDQNALRDFATSPTAASAATLGDSRKGYRVGMRMAF